MNPEPTINIYTKAKYPLPQCNALHLVGYARRHLLRATQTKRKYHGGLISITIECLNEALLEKRPTVASNRRKVMLLHDNARPHVKLVKEILMQLEGSSSTPIHQTKLLQTCSDRRSTAWWIHTSEITRMCKNRSMNGLLQKINRSIVAESTYCHKDGKNV